MNAATQQLKQIQLLAPVLLHSSVDSVDSLIEPSSHKTDTVIFGKLPFYSSRLIEISPTDKQAAISILLDKDVEELTFPEFNLGESRLPNAKRKAAVSYSTIVLAELRNEDRR